VYLFSLAFDVNKKHSVSFKINAEQYYQDLNFCSKNTLYTNDNSELF